MAYKILILGGGFTGLCLAHALRSKLKRKVHITIVEKLSKVGGCMNTIHCRSRNHFDRSYLFESRDPFLREPTLEIGEFIESLPGLQEKTIQWHPPSNTDDSGFRTAIRHDQ